MAFDFGNLLQQYLGGAPAADTAQVADDFHQVARNAPQETVGSGVAAALRSDQTPPFSQMIGQLFGNGDGQQRAGMLNQLISGLSPAVLGSLGGTLGGTLGSLLGGGATQGSQATQGAPTITAEQADQIDPAQVEQVAAHAEQHDPGVIDKMGNFYAAHPALVQTIGSAALSIAMTQIAQRMHR